MALEPAVRRLAAAAVLGVAVLGLPAAGAADGSSGSGGQGKQNAVIPALVQQQQHQYHQLRDQHWNNRQIPAGMQGPSRAFAARDSGVNAVSLHARNVDFHLAQGIGYHIDRLKAALVPVHEGEPVNFDDPTQYRIHILSGKVLIRPRDLNALFGHYLLRYAPRSLASVSNHTSAGTLKVDVGARLFSVLPPVGGMPTTLRGTIRVGEHNRLVYTPASAKSLGLPLLPMLSAVHLSLADLTPFARTGISLQGNQLVMNPERLFPPPKLQIDHISSAQLSDKGLTLTFTSETRAQFQPPPVKADSYIWMQSGDARFYDTVLVNAHLELLSQSRQPLAFHLYHYRAQSAAGSIHIRRDGALIVRVPNQFKVTDSAADLGRH